MLKLVTNESLNLILSQITLEGVSTVTDNSNGNEVSIFIR